MEAAQLSLKGSMTKTYYPFWKLLFYLHAGQI